MNSFTTGEIMCKISWLETEMKFTFWKDPSSVIDRTQLMLKTMIVGWALLVDSVDVLLE